MKACWMKPTLALCLAVLGLAFAATPVSAGDVIALFVIGRGANTGAVNDCAVFFGSECNLHTAGDMTATHFGGGTFILQIRTGAAVDANADGGLCFAANRSDTLGTGVFDQTAAITAPNGNSITFDTVGKLCEGQGILDASSLEFTATYRITGGTGQYAGAVGGGSLGLTVNRSTGETFLYMHGPIRY